MQKVIISIGRLVATKYCPSTSTFLLISLRTDHRPRCSPISATLFLQHFKSRMARSQVYDFVLSYCHISKSHIKRYAKKLTITFIFKRNYSRPFEGTTIFYITILIHELLTGFNLRSGFSLLYFNFRKRESLQSCWRLNRFLFRIPSARVSKACAQSIHSSCRCMHQKH